MQQPDSARNLADNLAQNVKQLREARGFTQQHIARLSGIPRPTWASIETGGGNPTLAVLSKLAAALQVSIEELVSAPRAQVAFFPSGFGPPRNRRGGSFRPLLPEAVPGLHIERIELKPGATILGVPHTQGTREYLTCERGVVNLHVSGETWVLSAGDAVAFRGDQKHSYSNGSANARSVAFSVVCFAPV